MKFHVVCKDTRQPVLELRPSEILQKFIPPDKADRYDLVMVKETIQQFRLDDGSVLSHGTVDLINEPDEPAPEPILPESVKPHALP